MSTQSQKASPEVVGMIPAAGQAKRLQPLPCSKELIPVVFGRDKKGRTHGPKVAAQFLLEKFQKAGISKVYVVIRDGKWDIPNYFRDGAGIGMSIAYVVISDSLGPPDTIDRAYPFIARNRIAFGFPDILFGPSNAFRLLIQRQEQTKTDVVLGLQRIKEPHTWDMVETLEDGRICGFTLKPTSTTLTFGWIAAVWTPKFSEFLHEFLRSAQTKRNLRHLSISAKDSGGDLTMGIVLQEALKSGFSMQSVKFKQATYLDIGTPDNLQKAMQIYQKS
jgi:glucose-1-phosphate thymidylyltransferase